MNKKINFSIAESDFYFKEIMVNTLLKNPFFQIVKNCNNGHELISQLYYRPEDIFIIELHMPIISGLETIKFIRQTGNKTPIITYSSTYQDDMFSLLNTLEAVYYCEKKSNIITDILKNCVLSAYKNYANYLENWKLQSDQQQAHMQRQLKSWYRPSVIEIQIMKLCYEGLSNKEIGQYLNLSSRTIDNNIAKLTQKLGLRNKIDLIRFCVEQGYYNSST